ncbi:type II restriction endonuclease [Candidatus Parcubacteria bacterium]|nr:MAG: type II restriction endonuclease [Candidatus Parcubacteria bacterium]
MFITPDELKQTPERIEEIEKSTLRLVTQAIYDYREMAIEIFREEEDNVADVAEDITREALDRLGMPRVERRLFGKVDYKRACYIFQPDFTVKQALFVDSKAEKTQGKETATLQITQTSMRIRQIVKGEEIDIPGKLPKILHVKGDSFLTTTIFVKYHYEETNGIRNLESITVASVPNGILQEKYNPKPIEPIPANMWRRGRDAPTLGEEFRVRLHFDSLKKKEKWRVQTIPLPPEPFSWDE